jgi:hypothetical protein
VVIKLDPLPPTPRFYATENSSPRRGINSPTHDTLDSFTAAKTPTPDFPALNLEKVARKWKIDNSPEPSQSRSPDPDSFRGKRSKKLTTEQSQKSDPNVKKSPREFLLKIPSRLNHSPKQETGTSRRKAFSTYQSNSEIMTLHPKFDDHESEIVSIGTGFKRGESQENLDRWSRLEMESENSEAMAQETISEEEFSQRSQQIKLDLKGYKWDDDDEPKDALTGETDGGLWLSSTNPLGQMNVNKSFCWTNKIWSFNIKNSRIRNEETGSPAQTSRRPEPQAPIHNFFHSIIESNENFLRRKVINRVSYKYKLGIIHLNSADQPSKTDQRGTSNGYNILYNKLLKSFAKEIIPRKSSSPTKSRTNFSISGLSGKTGASGTDKLIQPKNYYCLFGSAKIDID